MNARAELAARVNAVKLLGLDPVRLPIRILNQVLAVQQPVELQAAAATVLVRRGDSEVIESLLKRWPASPMPVRNIVMDGIFRNQDYLGLLLDAVEADQVSPLTLTRSRVAQLKRSRNQQIRTRAEALFKDVEGSRNKVIEGYRAALTGKGDSRRGQGVFKRSCSSCHRLGNFGSPVGPDLDDLAGRRSKGFFLIQILDPNADVSPGYEEYLVETQDGGTVTGVLASESATSITLRRKQGAEDTILRTNIATLRPLNVSAMPEGLEEEINVQQMADLLEFLQTPAFSK